MPVPNSEDFWAPICRKMRYRKVLRVLRLVHQTSSYASLPKYSSSNWRGEPSLFQIAKRSVPPAALEVQADLAEMSSFCQIFQSLGCFGETKDSIHRGADSIELNRPIHRFKHFTRPNVNGLHSRALPHKGD